MQPGDSWWSIAATVLGDPARTWPALAAANGGADRVLHPGDVLTVPGAAGTPPLPTPAPAVVPAPAPSPPPAGGGIPPFPGEARQGHGGPVVDAWQRALIAAGVMSDNPANRDGRYGAGMAGAVRRLQQSWGWSDADGIAGAHTWSRLHGGP